MRALELRDGRIGLNPETPRPARAEGEVLIRVRFAGICGTDLELRKGYMGFEGIPGHEFVGVIVEDGGEGWVGRRAVAEINCACGSCEYCRKNLPVHCPYRSVIGIDGRDGAFAEYIVVPVSNVHILPDGIPDRRGVMVEPFAAAMKAVDDAGIELGCAVAVLGDGCLGLMVARIAVGRGIRTTLVGKHREKMAFLAGSGVETWILDQVVREDARSGFDRVIECTGNADGLALGLELIRPRGRIVMKTTVAGKTEVEMSPLVIDEVELVGSRCGSFSKAIEVLDHRGYPLENLVTAVYDLQRWEEAFSRASEGNSLKVLFELGGVGW